MHYFTQLCLVLICAYFIRLCTSLIDSSCSKDAGSGYGCTCSLTKTRGISARCQVSTTTELTLFVHRPQDVIHLDLSENGLTQLEPQNLANFSNVAVLNVSGNPMLNLQDANLNQVLPRLTIIDMSGNSNWLNTSHVNGSGTLQIIRGTPQDGMCLRCFLVKHDVIIEDTRPWFDHVTDEMTHATTHPVLIYDGCYGNIISFKDKHYEEFVSLGYNLSCVGRDDRCFRGYKTLAFFQNYDVTPLNQCWAKMNSSSLFLIVLATFAMAINLTVVIVTVRSKVLRENVAFCLTGIVAVGDLTMAVYLVIIISARCALSYIDMMDLLETNFCHFVGFLLINSQGISAFTSFVVSLERYLAVVYCINPLIRIFPDTAKICAVVIFVSSFIFAILPYTVLSGNYVPDSHCVPVSNPTGGSIEYMMIPGGVVMMLYFATVPLYLHMYISVKKSSQSVGIKRERQQLYMSPNNVLLPSGTMPNARQRNQTSSMNP